MRFSLPPALSLCLAGAALAQPATTISEADYLRRARGLWLGEALANWTGLRTEGVRQQAPFLADADWGSLVLGPPALDFVTSLSPWPADDDTDVEYVYLHALESSPTLILAPSAIRDEWIDHVNRFIWVSNWRARGLMSRGVAPPATSLPQNNIDRLAIDAQLTTELFGVLAPGCPRTALDMADLPIAATARGHAAHAAQFYVLLHSFAWRCDPSMPQRDRIVWLVREARRHVPDTSKAADIADTVLVDYLANPDRDDWERTRDLVASRYQQNAPQHGFFYRYWYESSVNFGAGLTCLLYGEGDFRRTVRIGTLAGWDSDNQPAAMGGLIGSIIGDDGVRAAFPGRDLADTFWIARTRDNLPDRLPDDPDADDSFSLIAQRMLTVARRAVLDSGGLVDEHRGLWLLPPVDPAAPNALNPRHRLDQRSATNTVLRAGGSVFASTNAPGQPTSGGIGSPSVACDAREQDDRGVEDPAWTAAYFSSQGGPPPPGGIVTLTVTYDRDVPAAVIRFIEGDHFDQSGGWFDGLSFEVLESGAWRAAGGALSEPPDASRPYQIIDLALDQPGMIRAVRVSGPAGGAARFVTCCELDALAADRPPPRPTFDLNADGRISTDDACAWEQARTDLNGDGAADGHDREYILTAARWGEQGSMLAGRR